MKGGKEVKRRLKNALISALMITLVTAVGVWAYTALTGIIQLEVRENLSFVGDSEFQLEGYPGQTLYQEVTIANASPDDMNIDVGYVVMPQPPGNDLNVNTPKNVTVPGEGEATFEVTITISNSAAPAFYEIYYEIIR